MNRADALEKASKQSGLKAAYHHLWYGQKLGLIDPAESRAGWKVYTDRHVSQLVAYLKQHSRIRRGTSK